MKDYPKNHPICLSHSSNQRSLPTQTPRFVPRQTRHPAGDKVFVCSSPEHRFVKKQGQASSAKAPPLFFTLLVGTAVLLTAALLLAFFK